MPAFRGVGEMDTRVKHEYDSRLFSSAEETRRLALGVRPPACAVLPGPDRLAILRRLSPGRRKCDRVTERLTALAPVWKLGARDVSVLSFAEMR